jgi:hypothetical protein
MIVFGGGRLELKGGAIDIGGPPFHDVPGSRYSVGLLVYDQNEDVRNEVSVGCTLLELRKIARWANEIVAQLEDAADDADRCYPSDTDE